MNLYEQHRPMKWEDVVGQPKILDRIESIRARGYGGHAYWISGQSGTGKTTIARLLAAEIADPAFVEEIDATGLMPSDLRDIERSMSQFGWGKGGRAYIVNEAHGLRRDTVRQLLVMLERIPSHVMVIFTTTTEGQEALFEGVEDTAPLLSRCIRLDLARRDLAKPFAERVHAIATTEGLNGRPLEEYVKLAQKCRNNMRAMLMEVEQGCMSEAR